MGDGTSVERSNKRKRGMSEKVSKSMWGVDSYQLQLA
jgi:hypothetical protein